MVIKFIQYIQHIRLSLKALACAVFLAACAPQALSAMAMAKAMGQELEYAWEGDFEARLNVAGAAGSALAAYGLYKLYKADKFGVKTKTAHIGSGIKAKYRRMADKAWQWQVPQITTGAVTGVGVLLGSYFALDSLGLEPQAAGSIAIGLAASAGAGMYKLVNEKCGIKKTLTSPIQTALTFADIAGGVPQELVNTVKLIKERQAMSAEDRAVTPHTVRGIVLYGPPGTGKTRLAKAFAGQLGSVPFMGVQPTSLMSKWYGNTEAGVSAVFAEAVEMAKEHPSKMAILFMDEIDSIGAQRIASSDHHVPQPVNTLIEEMNKLEDSGEEHQVIVVVGTNRRDILDEAFKRRFNYQIEIGLPNAQKRRDIFLYYINKDLKLARTQEEENKMLETLVALTAGKNAADLAEIIKEVQRQLAIKAGTLSCSFIIKVAREMFSAPVKASQCACVRNVTKGIVTVNKKLCKLHNRLQDNNLQDKRELDAEMQDAKRAQQRYEALSQRQTSESARSRFKKQIAALKVRVPAQEDQVKTKQRHAPVPADKKVGFGL